MTNQRTIRCADNIVPLISFRAACLNCRDCTGPCWDYREMQALPAAVLKAKCVANDE